MIPQQTIDEIFTTARVEEVIGEFVQLKKSGSNLKGLSPFSNEKTPSFMVSPAKQIWKDFSSGKGGNVVTFLMEHEQFNYPEALKWLAKKYNIEIVEENQELTEEKKQELQIKESLFLITDFAKKFFVTQMQETEEGKNIGLSYFKERGFDSSTIQKFELGYSPQEWRSFADFATKKGYKKDLLDKSGLVIYKDNQQYFDRFRERVIFPIHSFSGRTLGFGARILKSNAKAAKYLNSPENEIYHKSNILYGIYQAKQAILQQNQCILVEGYTDVISLYQSGIQNVVASSGTALTPEQIRLIKRLTPNIILIYDGDSAGIKASFRGIDLILAQELNVKILLLPDGQDPDSFAQNHPKQEIKQYILENATDFIVFKSKVLLEDTNNDPVKKAEIVREILQSIALIPSLIQKEIYVREAAKLLNFREEVLFQDLANLQQKQQRQAARQNNKNRLQPLNLVKQEKKTLVSPIVLVEEEIIKLILQYGDVVIEDVLEEQEQEAKTVLEEIVEQISQDQLQLSNPIYQKIMELAQSGLEENQIRTGNYFLQLMDEDLNQITSNLMLEQHKLSDNWQTKQGVYIQSYDHGIKKKLSDTLLNFKLLHLQKIIQKKTLLLQNQNLAGDAREDLLQTIIQLTQYKNQIKNHLKQIL